MSRRSVTSEIASRQRRREGAEEGDDVILGDQPLRHGAGSGRRRGRIGDDQVDFRTAELFDPTGGIDFVSDQLDAIARVDAKLSIRSR